MGVGAERKMGVGAERKFHAAVAVFLLSLGLLWSMFRSPGHVSCLTLCSDPTCATSLPPPPPKSQHSLKPQTLNLRVQAFKGIYSIIHCRGQGLWAQKPQNMSPLTVRVLRESGSREPRCKPHFPKLCTIFCSLQPTSKTTTVGLGI